MSRDIAQYRALGAGEKLLDALRIEGNIASLVEHAQPLLDTKRPQPRKSISQQPFDPERTLLNAEQGELYYSWSMDGVDGLLSVAVNHAQEHFDQTADPTKPEDTRKSHRHLIDDLAAGGKRMNFLIITMHRKVMESLLQGNLISSEYEKADFCANTADSTRLHALPSIYLLQIVNVEYLDGARHPYAGRGLSWREWKETLRAVKQYADDSEADHVDAGTWVDQVDASFPDRDTRKWGKEQHCRYLANKRQKLVLAEFIAAAEKIYVAKGQELADINPTDPALDIPMARVPQECGWATSGIERARAHSAGGQFSNTLFSLFHCILRELWGRKRWEVKERKLLDITDPWDAPVGEYLCSEVGQTYWYQGGLNPALAGTMALAGQKRSLTSEEYEHLWRESKVHLDSLNYLEDNLAHYKKRHDDCEELIRQMNEMSMDEGWDETEQQQARLKDTLDYLVKGAKDHVSRCLIEDVETALEPFKRNAEGS